jgi:hypothetical protein
MTNTHSKDDRDRIQREYDRRWFKHIAATLACLVYLLMVGFGLSSLVGRLILMPAGIVICALYDAHVWRCPNCTHWFGRTWWRLRCPSCGVAFSHAIKFG